MGSDRNSAVDVAKFAAALMVIGIHTAIFSDINDIIYCSVVHIICRVAVPFFAVCTGYYIGSKVSFSEKLETTKANKTVFFRQWKKFLILYAVWTGLYLLFSIPFWLQIGWFSPMAFVDYAVATLTSGSHYHLWYLLYMLYSLPAAYLLLRWVPKRRWGPLIAILWVIAIWVYTYKTFLPSCFLKIGSLERFSMLPILLPLILTGIYISKEAKRKTKRFYIVGLLTSITFLSLEVFLLRYLGIEKVSFIAFTLPTAYFLFHLVLESSLRNDVKYAGLLGEISTFVYCVHPMFIETIGKAVGNSVVTYLLVAFVSIILGFFYCLMNGKLNKKKDVSCFN